MILLNGHWKVLLKNFNLFSNSRKILYRWTGWFFTANALLYCLICLHYFQVIPSPSAIPEMDWRGWILSWGFIVISFPVQMTILSFIISLPVFILIFLYPRRKWVFCFSILLSTLFAQFLFVDTIAYQLFHFHMWGIVWQLFKTHVLTDVIALSSKEKVLFIISLFIFLGIEIGLSYFIWRKIKNNSQAPMNHGKIVSFAFFAGLLISYMLMIRSSGLVGDERIDFAGMHQIVMEAQAIPFYDDMLGAFFPNGSQRLETAGSGFFIQLQHPYKQLQYPKQPLICQPTQHPLNILFIVLDDWRFDMVNSSVTPYIEKFSKKTWQFQKEFSGGNATGPGIFSLFYSLPYNYWTAMLAEKKGPVFIDELLKQDYEMAVFRSASMKFPAFDQTVFKNVKNLQIETEGSLAYERDEKITAQFLNFLKNRNKEKPFFGFLFYDATHNYCESVPHYLKPFEPAVKVCDRLNLTQHSDPLPYLNRYKNAVYYVDGLIEEVLKQLKQQGLLDKTIVVITADHGEEFNENHGDFWGHASDYTHWQLHVPLIIYWPGQQPKIIHHLTTHYDVIPYLMQNALHIKNSMSDYSVGQSLLADEQRHFFVAASYIDYAMITPSTITRVYPQGNYVIKDETGKTLPNQSLDPELLKKTFEQLNRYFQ